MEMPRGSLTSSVVLSYVAFVLVGVSAGVGGVLIPAQIRDYDIDMATIGLTFVTFSVGFFVAGTSVGALISRLGMRGSLLAGGACFVAAELFMATRPAFLLFVVVQALAGYGIGVLESALNVHLSALPSAASLLNRLHGFFGVGALLGPLLASWMLTFAAWPAVLLVLALLTVPVPLGFAVVLPRDGARGEIGDQTAPARHGMLRTILRDRAVLLAAAFLAVYVGLEVSTGNWAYTYLVDERGSGALAAGWAVSAYWLGLTVGRFVISPLANRVGVSSARTMLGCLVAVVVVTLLTWAAPGAAVAGGFAALGFFLGPLFPTAMAMVPTMTEPSLVPTAIGVMNGVSVIGGAALPWLAGAIAEGVGIGVLLGYVAVLGVAQLVLWQAAVTTTNARSAQADVGG